MDSVKRNIYSHGKEFYKADADFYVCVYDEKIYYMNSEYLCYSDTDGGDIRIITGEKRYKNAYIHVNPTGIYLYKRGSTNTYLDVKRIGFDGSSVLEVKEKGRISYVYIYGDKIYYVKKVPGAAEIRCMDMTGGTITTVYSEASEADRLCVAENCIIFRAMYKGSRRGYPYDDKVWMVMDRSGGRVNCLSGGYGGNDSGEEIVYCDPNRNILWTERKTSGGDLIWEPRPIWGGRNSAVSGMPVWNMSGKLWIDDGRWSREYFDGEHFYQSDSYYIFDSADERGRRMKWNESGHGACDQFTVSGGYLFLDLEALGEEQYQLTKWKSPPLRKTWFKEELSQEVKDQYEQRLKKPGRKNQAETGTGPKAGRIPVAAIARTGGISPLQLMKDTAVVSSGSEFWAFNTSGKRAENRFKINCVYEEDGVWHVIEKKEGLVRGAEYVQTSPLMTVYGNVCFFAEGRKNGKCQEFFVICRREGAAIVLETFGAEGVSGLSDDLIHTAIVRGEQIRVMGRNGQWLSFNMDTGVVSKEQVPLPPMHSEFEPWKDGFNKMYTVEAFFYKGYIYTVYFGMQNCMFRFPLECVQDIEHVSLIDASTGVPGMRFVVKDSSFVYKNVLYNIDFSGFYTLNLDTMVYTLVSGGHFQIIGKMTDNRVLIQTEDNIYRLYDLDQKKWYRFNEHFFNARKNGDDVKILYVSYSGPYVIFSYKKTDVRVSYSVMTWPEISNQNAMLVDFAVK